MGQSIGRAPARAALTSGDINDGIITAAKVAADVATQAELDGLVDSAPGALDTLNEIAAALNDDADFSTSVATSIATKLPKAGGAMTGAITTNSTFDGRDVAADGATADAALPKAGGAMTGAITTNSTFDGVDIATRDGVLTSTTTTAGAALPKAGGTMTGNIVMGDDTSIGISDSAERIEFDGAGDISILGANLGIGTAAPLYGLSTAIAYAKTDTTQRNAVFFGSNEASTPAGLAIRVTGHGSAQTTRNVSLQTVEYGIASSGHLSLQDSGGKVGIGTMAPDCELHVLGGGSPSIRITDSTNTVTGKFQSDNTVSKIGTHTNHPFEIYTNNTTAMTILANRKVGIGMTDPVSKVNISNASGGSNADATLTIRHYGIATAGITVGADGHTYIANDADASDIRFCPGGTFSSGAWNTAADTKMVIEGTGNVGIGTVAPYSTLFLKPKNYPTAWTDTARYDNCMLALPSTTAMNDDAIIGFGGGGGGSTHYAASYIGFQNKNAGDQGFGDLVFGTRALNLSSSQPTERMRIHSDGKVCMGENTGAPWPNAEVSCFTYDNAGFVLNVRHDGNATTSSGIAIICGPNTVTSTATTLINFMDGDGSSHNKISMASGATTYGSNSDYRLKENCIPLTNAIDRLNGLKPIQFNFIRDPEDTTMDGFLAHEAQEFVPRAVTGEKDAMMNEQYEVTPAVEEVRDDDDNITTEAVPAVMGEREVPDIQGIDLSKIVPLLVGALQEAIARIETLEAA